MNTRRCEGCNLENSPREQALSRMDVTVPLHEFFEIALLHLPSRGRYTTEAGALLESTIGELYESGIREVFLPVTQTQAAAFFEAIKSSELERLASMRIAPEILRAAQICTRLGMNMHPLWQELSLEHAPVSGSQALAYVTIESTALLAGLRQLMTTTSEEGDKTKVLVLHYKQPHFNDVFPQSLCRLIKYSFPKLEVHKCIWLGIERPWQETHGKSALDD